MRSSFAIIPTHDRPTEFATCLAAITPQVDTTIAICHGRNALEYTATADAQVLYEPTGRANISHMWNLGLNKAHELAGGAGYDVAVLNDDAIPSQGWFVALVAAMRAAGAVGASEGRCPGSRMIAGWAFVLDGDAALRADERFVHWCGDDDLQRQAGRWAIVVGVTTPNTRANSTSRSPEAKAQIARDEAAFAAKWG